MTRPNLAAKPGAVALMVLMAATRFDHFGTHWALPDASLAVFFFAGVCLYTRGILVALLVEAACIDYFAIQGLGVSDYCMSPAYLFLIPAYIVMWLGGRYSQRVFSKSLVALTRSFGGLLVATSLAFVISNTSFYLLSDKVAMPNWAQYLDVFLTYYPAYVSSTVAYGLALSMLSKLLGSLRSRLHPVALFSGQ